jgi:hypothetical protein
VRLPLQQVTILDAKSKYTHSSAVSEWDENLEGGGSSPVVDRLFLFIILFN